MPHPIVKQKLLIVDRPGCKKQVKAGTEWPSDVCKCSSGIFLSVCYLPGAVLSSRQVMRPLHHHVNQPFWWVLLLFLVSRWEHWDLERLDPLPKAPQPYTGTQTQAASGCRVWPNKLIICSRTAQDSPHFCLLVKIWFFLTCLFVTNCDTSKAYFSPQFL